jgi:hypothetical protein
MRKIKIYVTLPLEKNGKFKSITERRLPFFARDDSENEYKSMVGRR